MQSAVCVTLFYRYYNEFYSDEIWELVSVNSLFLHDTPLSSTVHLFVLDLPINCRNRYKRKEKKREFSSWWNNLPEGVFSKDVGRFKWNLYRNYSFCSQPITHYLSSGKVHCICRRRLLTTCPRQKEKNIYVGFFVKLFLLSKK